MNDINKILNECLSYDDELEWVEYEENMFVIDDVGQYISALSNSAAILGKPNAYMIWGIDNRSHNITGTVINYNADNNGEPIQHYLARNLSPSIVFSFEDVIYDGKRLVLLTVPAANKVPTEFERERFIRIGSNKNGYWKVI